MDQERHSKIWKLLLTLRENPEIRESQEKGKVDGDTVRGDTGCKKNERKILCPRAWNISLRLSLSQEVSVKLP